jgi:hypothetical protein
MPTGSKTTGFRNLFANEPIANVQERNLITVGMKDSPAITIPSRFSALIVLMLTKSEPEVRVKSSISLGSVAIIQWPT